MSHQINLPGGVSDSQVHPDPGLESTQHSPANNMLAYLLFVVATILLCISPALVVAVWRWVF